MRQSPFMRRSCNDGQGPNSSGRNMATSSRLIVLVWGEGAAKLRGLCRHQQGRGCTARGADKSWGVMFLTAPGREAPSTNIKWCNAPHLRTAPASAAPRTTRSLEVSSASSSGHRVLLGSGVDRVSSQVRVHVSHWAERVKWEVCGRQTCERSARLVQVASS